MQQVDAIFSKTRKGGAAKDIKTWGDLGLTGEWADKPISLYGRNSASGTYGYFKEHALFNGDYKDAVKEQPGSSAVVQGVASDKYAIGYSGIGYKTADVQAVPLARTQVGVRARPSPQRPTAASTRWPASCSSTSTASRASKLDPLRGEFIKYVFSKQGQEDVVKDGYLPVLAPIAEEGAENGRVGK